jgi:hypothetical protein
VQRCYVDLGLGQFGFYIGDSTRPIISLDQETGFRPYQLYLRLFCGILESRLVHWNKIKLCQSIPLGNRRRPLGRPRFFSAASTLRSPRLIRNLGIEILMR